MSHCQIGVLAPLQALVFDWLEKAVNEPESLPQRNWGTIFEVMKKYLYSDVARSEVEELAKILQSGAN